MSWKKITGGVALVAIAGFAWVAEPYYAHFAHRGKVPMSPFGWVKLPEAEQSPTSQELYKTAYQQAGNNTLAALEAHRAKIGAPSMSAAVSIKGELVWAGTAGWANIRQNKPATIDTQYRVGSTSKAITATALARLVEKGVIDLDAPISTYWDNLPNDAWANMTMRQLASHMAGMPHYGDNTDGAGQYEMVNGAKHFDSMSKASLLFDESDLLFAPGEKFEYSSLGTVLMGATMEQATGKLYEEIIKEEVLTPAKMESTIVAPRKASTNDTLATFYYHEDENFKKWRPTDLSHRLPGGGWASTPSDLVRMGSLYFTEGYLRDETIETFWAPQRLNNGEVNEQDYAIGWRWREWDADGVEGKLRNANHGGVSAGSQSWLFVFPDYEMSIAFNVNMKTEEFYDFGIMWEAIAKEFVLAHPDYPANIEAE